MTKSLFGVLGMVWLLVAAPVLAEEPLTEAQEKDLAAVEAFLNDITTLQARFLQVASDGSYADGLFWLSRPGLARFEYAPPVDLLLVADGYRLKFYDAEVDQVVDMSLDTGPFRFLLGETVDIRHDMIVRGIERRGDVLRVAFQDRVDPREGTVTLTFEGDPMRLRQWEVHDAQGNITGVTLYQDRYGLDLDPSLFRFTENDRLAPDFRRGRYD